MGNLFFQIPKNTLRFMEDFDDMEKYIDSDDSVKHPPREYGIKKLLHFYKGLCKFRIYKNQLFHVIAGLYEIIWLNNMPKTYTACKNKECSGDNCWICIYDMFIQNKYYIQWQYFIKDHPVKFTPAVQVFLPEEGSNEWSFTLFFFLERTDKKDTYITNKNGFSVDGMKIEKGHIFYPVKKYTFGHGDTKINLTDAVILAKSAIQSVDAFLSLKK